MNASRFRSFLCEGNRVAVGDVACGRCGKTGNPFKSVGEDLRRGSFRLWVTISFPVMLPDRDRIPALNKAFANRTQTETPVAAGMVLAEGPSCSTRAGESIGCRAGETGDDRHEESMADLIKNAPCRTVGVSV